MKTTPLLLAAVFLPAVALAQTPSGMSEMTDQYTPYDTTSATATMLQLKVGPGFSSWSNTGSTAGVDVTSRTSMNFAVEAEFPLTPSVSIVTGLDYLSKGFGFAATQSGVTVDAYTSVKYLEIPALMKLNFGDETRFTLFAGPYLAFKAGVGVGGTVKAAGLERDFDAPSTMSDTFDKQISSTDYGARLGGGLEMPMSHTISVLLHAAYDLGLKDLSATADGNPVKNRMLLTTAGLGFKL